MSEKNTAIETEGKIAGLIIGIIFGALVIIILAIGVMSIEGSHKYDAVTMERLDVSELRSLAQNNLKKGGNSNVGVVSNPIWFKVKGANKIVIMYPGSGNCDPGLMYDGYDKKSSTLTFRIEKLNYDTPCTMDLVQYWYLIDIGKSQGFNLKIDTVKVKTSKYRAQTIKKAEYVNNVI